MVTNRGRQGAVYRRTQDGLRCGDDGYWQRSLSLPRVRNVSGTGHPGVVAKCHDRGVGQTYLRILRFQVLYGNIPGVQIPIPHPHHTRRPKLHSRTKFQATEKQQEQQQQPIDAKHRAIYCYYVLVACKLKERRARAASQQSMNSDMFPNAIHRRDTSTPRQTLDKDTCRSRRNTIQIETHGHDTCFSDAIFMLLKKFKRT